MKTRAAGIAVLAAILFTAFSPTVDAQAVAKPFMTVDAVSVRGSSICVTGVVEGEATPAERCATFRDSNTGNRAFETCHRSLLFALSRPGLYLAYVGNYYDGECSIKQIAP